MRRKRKNHSFPRVQGDVVDCLALSNHQTKRQRYSVYTHQLHWRSWNQTTIAVCAWGMTQEIIWLPKLTPIGSNLIIQAQCKRCKHGCWPDSCPHVRSLWPAGLIVFTSFWQSHSRRLNSHHIWHFSLSVFFSLKHFCLGNWGGLIHCFYFLNKSSLQVSSRIASLMWFVARKRPISTLVWEQMGASSAWLTVRE